MTIAATNYAGATNWTFTITVPNPRPATPTNLYLLSATENSVTLAWAPEDPVAGSVTYSVFIPHPYHSPRGSGGGVNYQLVGSTTSTNFTLSGLTPNTSYTFDVNATGPGGTSGYAGISVTTLGPQPPANLRVTGITSTSISLAWDPSPGPVPIVRYEILGWIGGLFPTIGYGTNFTGTTATITGLTPGTYEEWSVRAYDAAGNVSGFAPGIYAVNPVPTPATLSIPVAPPNFSLAGGGGFQFTVQANAVQTTLIQATTNLADPTSWVTIATNPPSSSAVQLHGHQRQPVPDALLPGGKPVGNMVARPCVFDGVRDRNQGTPNARICRSPTRTRNFGPYFTALAPGKIQSRSVSGSDTFCTLVVATLLHEFDDKALVACTTNGAVPPVQLRFTFVPAGAMDKLTPLVTVYTAAS